MISIMLNILAWVSFILLFLVGVIIGVLLITIIKAIIDNTLKVIDRK